MEMDRTAILRKKIIDWDELAKDNDGNKHDLSTSERQDWIDELNDIVKNEVDDFLNDFLNKD